MQTTGEELSEGARLIVAFEADLQRPLEAIRAQLAHRPRRHPAAVPAACHEITRLTRGFAPLFARITGMQNAERARADAEARAAGVRVARMPQHWHDVNTRLNHLRLWLNRWPEINALIDRQFPPRRRPLYPATPDEIGTAQLGAADALVAMLHQVLAPREQSDAAYAHGCFQDILLPSSRFMADAHAAHRLTLAQGREVADFVDVGCGSGLKLLSALQFFRSATGLEFDPASAAAGDDLMRRAGRPEARVIEADALAYDGYDRFDVIYFFRPMRHDDRMRALESRIVAQARPGTVLIAPYTAFRHVHEGLGCAHVAGAIYLSGTSRTRATALRREAEYIGPDVAGAHEPVRTIWTGILAASAANGYLVQRRHWINDV